MEIQEAEHAETHPDSPILIINKLNCSLVGRTQTIQITPNTLTDQAYGSKTTVEQFQCSYGLNEEYRTHLIKGDLKIAGIDADENIRIVELAHHPFFIATLFLPQLTSTPQRPHPLVKAYLKAIATDRR
jgi:CTP synthase (UTP-ammonia lyase)